MRTLITGASSGLGAGMARELAGRGHDLALVARRTDRLEALAAELTARPGAPAVHTAALDVTDDEAVARVVPAMRDALGGLDRVVVNAGAGGGRPIGSGRPGANLATARTNFVGAIATCEAAMEIFRAQGSGHLVVVTSVAADRGLRGASTVYAATKAGLHTFVEGLQADVVGTPIAVTELAPGFIRTDLNEGMTMPFAVDLTPGVVAMVEAIERRPAHAYVPRWPWAVLGRALRVMPMPLLRRIT
ncbi:SDR family oxidoreductase [Actinomycetospora sp. TBRC 11914]|uniref:SDR family oxidoreductase n=1 Tax=Actinomycetospora sp. TBRC 11914 TaxID=2729387 RepID=UPI00145C602F|nr:SDR family oxidoreductase [Actinomycetospora sp. TBRC 11914]NMO89388.1 SDR family oxidoreductase [Actinomycetospora sp. TBRC 11914]